MREYLDFTMDYYIRIAKIRFGVSFEKLGDDIDFIYRLVDDYYHDTHIGLVCYLTLLMEVQHSYLYLWGNMEYFKFLLIVAKKNDTVINRDIKNYKKVWDDIIEFKNQDLFYYKACEAVRRK